METVNAATASAQSADNGSRVGSAVEAERESSTISDFNDFLTLLTAQMKNQDPLQPLDSTQFVEQLASFSAVEQQVGTNKKLNELIAQGQSAQIGELGPWIGKTVRADKALLPLDDNGLKTPVPEQASATSIEAVVSNAKGDEIARFPLAKTEDEFSWSGKTADGRSAPHGSYGVAFEYSFDGEPPRVIEASAHGQVIEARLDDEGALLTLDNGSLVRPEDVDALTLAKPDEENG